MDKRFFLALFLSLIVIAISQLLFPPARQKPVQPTVTRDSLARAASSTPTSSSTRQTAAAQALAVTIRTDSGPRRQVASVETTTVTLPKTLYRFSNVGAAPISVVIRDYQNRSATGTQVDLGLPGSALFGYRLITPSDTVDLTNVAFTVVRGKTTAGEETLIYSASPGKTGVSITYTIPTDTAASYVMRVQGRVTGAQTPTYLVTELPRTLRPTEADTIGDHRTLAY